MTTPEANTEFTRARYEYYINAGRAAKLWYALTIIKLILGIIVFLTMCVGGILSAGTITLIIQSLIQSFSSAGF